MPIKPKYDPNDPEWEAFEKSFYERPKKSEDELAWERRVKAEGLSKVDEGRPPFKSPAHFQELEDRPLKTEEHLYYDDQIKEHLDDYWKRLPNYKEEKPVDYPTISGVGRQDDTEYTGRYTQVEGEWAKVPTGHQAGPVEERQGTYGGKYHESYYGDPGPKYPDLREEMDHSYGGNTDRIFELMNKEKFGSKNLSPEQWDSHYRGPHGNEKWNALVGQPEFFKMLDDFLRNYKKGEREQR